MKNLIVIFALLTTIAAGYGGYRLWWTANFYTVEKTEVNESKDPYEELGLVDDRIDEKPLEFDEDLVDSRLYEDWQINWSNAVFKMDCPDIRPDYESELLRLYPSYSLAAAAAKQRGMNLLPSANMIDGAAKQFDDGLYAALDLACYEGKLGFAPSAVDFTAKVFDRLNEDDEALPYLAACLEIANRRVELTEAQQQAAGRWMKEFESKPALSKPISFYTWSEDLGRVWKFFRYLQRPFEQDEIAIPLQIADVISGDPELLAEYESLVGFYSSLTNPPGCLMLTQLEGEDSNLAVLAKKHQINREIVCVFPPSTSKDTELFNKMFASQLASGTNLMVALVKRIRSGEVDLQPREGAGWYEHQVYALETLLLPDRGAEADELLMTAKYKRRLLQAFEAMITKRRETHARQLMAGTDSAAARPPDKILPRFRIEPCATYYLRTARSYAFLKEFLTELIGQETLKELQGLRASGPRESDLDAELNEVMERAYGFYLISCEDIGMAPELGEGELVDPKRAYDLAAKWLEDLSSHRDLAADTRVSIPVLTSQFTNTTRLWATIGVRFSKLEVSFANAPSIRESESSAWQEVERFRLGKQKYVILVDEFAEVELSGNRALTRDELRTLCDKFETKDQIVDALEKY